MTGLLARRPAVERLRAAETAFEAAQAAVAEASEAVDAARAVRALDDTAPARGQLARAQRALAARREELEQGRAAVKALMRLAEQQREDQGRAALAALQPKLEAARATARTDLDELVEFLDETLRGLEELDAQFLAHEREARALEAEAQPAAQLADLSSPVVRVERPISESNYGLYRNATTALAELARVYTDRRSRL